MAWTKKQKLIEAIENNDAASVTALQASFSDKSAYFVYCQRAIDNKAPAALTALLTSKGGFDYEYPGNYYDSRGAYINNRKKAQRLIKGAMGEEGLVTALYEANKITDSNSRLKNEEFLVRGASLQLIQECLEEDPQTFDACVNNVGLNDTEKLKFMLTFADRIKGSQKTLDDALVSAAGSGDVAKAELLLARGANASFEGGRALLHAGKNDQQDMVALLLSCVDLGAHGRDLATQLEQTQAAAAVTEAVQVYTEQAAAEKAQEPDVEIGGGTALIDANTISDTQELPNGATLMKIFNFQTRQQQNIVSAPDTPASIETVNFDKVDPAVVKDMRDKLNVLKATTPKP